MSFNNNTKDETTTTVVVTRVWCECKDEEMCSIEYSYKFLDCQTSVWHKKEAIFFLKEKLIHERQLFKHTTDLVSYKSVKRESLFHQRVSSDRERDIFDSLILSFFVKRHTYCRSTTLSLCSTLI